MYTIPFRQHLKSAASAMRPKPASPESGEAEEYVLGQYIPLLYHYNMLQDEDRVGAFREAIELVVQPGMHVLELGGGTGILSSFAARQGATVSCVERNPELVACAEQFLQQNGLADRVSVIHADASRYVPNRPVDAVICEMLHVGLLREKQAQVISAFKRRYARVHGSHRPVFLPEASILMAQPVQQCFDFSGYHAPVPLFQAPRLHQPRTTVLAPLAAYANVSYGDAFPLEFRTCQRAIATAEGCVNSIRLVTQNVIAIDVDEQRAITWPNQCLVLPIPTPFAVATGQEIELSFAYAAGNSIESFSESLRLRPHPFAGRGSRRAA